MYTCMSIYLGKNTDHGHFLCHIKHPVPTPASISGSAASSASPSDSAWVCYNDEKVAKTDNPPLEHGFMYLYTRNDNKGSL